MLQAIFDKEQSAQSKAALNGNNNEDIFDTLSHEASRKQRLIESLLLGELHRLYKQMRLKQQGFGNVTIMDDGTHECSKHKCTIKPIHGTAYFFAKGKVHVCLQHQGHVCQAPTDMHTGHQMQLPNLLFCCVQSGKAHVCTPDDCDAPQQNHDGTVVCQLTGKVLGAAKLSFGWIEDEWRPVFRQRKNKATLPVLDKVIAAVTKAANNTMINSRNTLIALSFQPKPKDLLQLQHYAKMYSHVHAYTYKLIRGLMHGSEDRKRIDINNVQKVKSKITNAWYKHAKLAKQNGQKIDFTKLQLALLNELSTLIVSPCAVDQHRMDTLCRNYALHIISYVNKLLKYTELVKQELNWSDIVLAILYLKCTKFRIRNHVLIDLDPFLLQHLPAACMLHEFSMLQRHNFTQAKTNIQATLIEASEKGVPLDNLTMDPMSVLDLL